jgi:hypothetical protein
MHVSSVAKNIAKNYPSIFNFSFHSVQDAERRDSIPEEEAKENNLEKQRELLLKNLNAATATATIPVKETDVESSKVPEEVNSSSKTATDATSS